MQMAIFNNYYNIINYNNKDNDYDEDTDYDDDYRHYHHILVFILQEKHSIVCILHIQTLTVHCMYIHSTVCTLHVQDFDSLHTTRTGFRQFVHCTYRHSTLFTLHVQTFASVYTIRTNIQQLVHYSCCSVQAVYITFFHS